jgi:putative hydrolase of the HAD superfamily
MSFVNSFDGFIFDYGGVLVRHQTEAEQAQMAKIAGISLEQFQEFYWKDRSDYDKGLLTGTEYWQAIGQQADKLLTLHQINELVELDNLSWLNFDEPMWKFVDDLRSAGKRLAILSNMPADLGEAIKARTNRFNKFDFVTLSFEVKSVKPEAQIYEHCLTGIGTEPNRTLFFDDKIANVKGAEMLGIAAVEFLDRDTVLAKVRA